MKYSRLICTAAFLCAAQTAFAQDTPQVTTQSEPGKVTVTGTIKSVSTIVGIEPSTRTIWLKDAKDRVVQVVVGEEARNFEQLKLGDKVSAEYSQAVTVTLKKTHTAPSANATESIERAALGAKPGGSAAREVTVIANVTAIDHQSGMLTLKGPQGNSVQLVVQDPEQLKRIKKGDQLEVVYNEAVAISVEPKAGN
ncbi:MULTISPECIES: hypothetical protein [Bacteria]|uniref:hypothetical protein n=1 Tax=Bacteria TaxID=2 RepID=UPI00094AD3D4|nr:MULTISPECIES: hypothetical protein [Bacteria]KAB0445093.1 hypothetical protein CH314_04120 [Lysinibacillus fusiformis]OLL31290.1 hypothetical protein BTH42_13365 [Burkholderia sp. SRS-W-2-2016]